MALKKSELYSSLWSSCDELRGGMDASQYKDYVLVLLFIKYVSDKYAGQPFAPIKIPNGASFKEMVALKGKTDIGDQINKKIVAPLASANQLSDLARLRQSRDSLRLGEAGAAHGRRERATAIRGGASQQNDDERPTWSGSRAKTRDSRAMVPRATAA
jgi:hypothetical protein